MIKVKSMSVEAIIWQLGTCRFEGCEQTATAATTQQRGDFEILAGVCQEHAVAFAAAEMGARCANRKWEASQEESS